MLMILETQVFCLFFQTWHKKGRKREERKRKREKEGNLIMETNYIFIYHPLVIFLHHLLISFGSYN